MEYRPIEVNVICARDLKDVNVISTMDVYVICSVSGDPRSTQRTPINKGGGTHPKWNHRMKFAFDEPAARVNRLGLVFQITSDRTLGDKEIGRVYVSLKDLFDAVETAGKDGNSGDIAGEEKTVTYQVQTPVGKFKGYLDFSYKFGEKFNYNVDRGFDGPVLAHPPGCDLSHTEPGLYLVQNGPGSGQPEPGSYLVQPGPGLYPSQPGPAYPPPSGYGHGYPGQGQGYGYGYPGQVPGRYGYESKGQGLPSGYGYGYSGQGQGPSGYGYPSQGQGVSGYGYPGQGQGPSGYGYPSQGQGVNGYGYPVQGSNVYGYPGQGSSSKGQPKSKKGSKIGKGAAMGVGAGLLGGLLVGEMVEDVAEIAAYDEMMDVGGGMFGF